MATFTTTQTTVEFTDTDTDGAVSFTATGPTVTFTAGYQSVPSSSGGLDAEQVRDTVAAFVTAGSNVTVTHDDTANTLTIASSGGGSSTVPLILADWSVKVFPTGGTIPGLEMFPGDDLAAWESVTVTLPDGTYTGVPAVWDVPVDEGMVRVLYADLVDPTRTGVYDYTPGVSFVRSSDANTTAELHNRYASARLNRNHTDNSPVTLNAWGFIPNILYLTAADPTDAIGTASWRFNVVADLDTVQVFFSFITGLTGLSWTPVDADWSGTDPANFAEAINRLAADTRWTDARTPTAHKTSHEDGGSDELALNASQITAGTLDIARLPSFPPVSLQVSGRYIRTAHRSAAAAPTTNRVWYLPIWIDTACTVDHIGVLHEATTGGASSVARLAIYTNVGNMPASKLVEATVSTATAAAFKPAPISESLTRGLWWLAMSSQPTSGAPTFAWGNPPIMAGDATGSASGALFDSSTYSGTFPSTASPGAALATQPPLVYLRIV